MGTFWCFKWSFFWEGPAVPPSLGVAFKDSLFTEAHHSFVLFQRPSDRDRPTFGSEENTISIAFIKEQKSLCGVGTE